MMLNLEKGRQTRLFRLTGGVVSQGYSISTRSKGEWGSKKKWPKEFPGLGLPSNFVSSEVLVL